jgi:hypothetical protein
MGLHLYRQGKGILRGGNKADFLTPNGPAPVQAGKGDFNGREKADFLTPNGPAPVQGKGILRAGIKQIS